MVQPLTLCIILPCLLSPWLLFGQNAEVSFGMGLPEVPNIGIRYIDTTLTAGGSYGRLPSQGIRTINVDVGFHYGKEAKNAPFRKSVFRFIYTNYREETDIRIFRYAFLSLRAGRNYFFTKQFGLNLEGGIAFELDEKVESKDGSPVNNVDFIYDSVLPSLSLRLFYRF